MAQGPTKTTDLVDPKVYADAVQYQLKQAMRFTPLAQVDNTLQGVAGSTLVFPKFTYIGDATEVGEGEAIPLDKLGQTTAEVKVKKASKGVSITDEARVNGYGDAYGESARQQGVALGNKLDTDLMNVALQGSQTATIAAPTVDGLQQALDVFNDDGDYTYVAIMSPKNASALRADAVKNKVGSEVGANQLITGTYLDIYGTQIVRTRKMADDKIVLIKVDPASPALKLVMKRDVTVKTDQDIIHDTTIMTAGVIYAPYLYDDSKVVVATINKGK